MNTLIRNIAVVIGVSGIMACTSGVHTDSQKSSLSQMELSAEVDLLEMRGKQLRKAIEQEYQRLMDSKTLTPRNGGNISEVVLNFIPIGTSFDDAEQILRNAGFEVGLRYGPSTATNSPIHLPNERYALATRITNLDKSIFSLFTFRTVTVIASLSPRDPNNYDKVNEVSASIFLSYP